MITASSVSRRLHTATGLTISPGARRHRYQGVFIENGRAPGHVTIHIDMDLPRRRNEIRELLLTGIGQLGLTTAPDGTDTRDRIYLIDSSLVPAPEGTATMATTETHTPAPAASIAGRPCFYVSDGNGELWAISQLADGSGFGGWNIEPGKFNPDNHHMRLSDIRVSHGPLTILAEHETVGPRQIRDKQGDVWTESRNRPGRFSIGEDQLTLPHPEDGRSREDIERLYGIDVEGRGLRRTIPRAYYC